ncbi:hypothetical protein AALP_AA6G200800 [Arabis alpina]|uniref:Uncharacterized protein n=1 Tax=Arabis alpina TaxID=50452 RepID=A0A087GQG7_ARAAL|nr:hypothetical protein AALP_AA6G200800 [Arabis alpina]
MPLGMRSSSVGDEGLMLMTRGVGGPRSSLDADDPRTTSSGSGRVDDTDVIGTRCVEAKVFVDLGTRPNDDTEAVETRHSLVTDGSLFVDDTDPQLPFGRGDASSSSSSSDSGASIDEDEDEDMFVEVEKTNKAKKVKKKAKVKINPRGIRHLLGIYVLSRECGVIISTENLSYLTDFRVRGRCEELMHTVTNSSGMALITGYPSKDDHFEDRFLFAEISERTIEADCIDLVKTRWERRVKSSLPEVSKEFITAMHIELSSGNGNWRKSFNRKRIERAFSAEIFPGKILGRGQARVSFRGQIKLKVAAKAKRSSGSSTPKVVAPMSSTSTALSARARPSRPLASKTLLPPPSLGEFAEFRRLSVERARISSSKGKCVDRETPSKRQRVDTLPAVVVGRETSVSRVGGLLRNEAYSAVKSKASELSLFFDRLVSDYDEDIHSRDGELGAAKEANAVLQLRLDETVERNEVLERDALALQKVKKDYEDKLAKLKLRCTKAEGEVVQLRGDLSSASDLQLSKIDDAVAKARDERTRIFAERTSEVAGLLTEIGGKAQNDMLNLTEIDANLEFICLLQGSEPPDLLTEVKALRGWRHLIYDAYDVFADLLASVRRVLEIHVVFAGAVEASVTVDDDVEVSDEDDVKVTDDDEDAED